MMRQSQSCKRRCRFSIDQVDLRINRFAERLSRVELTRYDGHFFTLENAAENTIKRGAQRLPGPLQKPGFLKQLLGLLPTPPERC